LISDVYVPLTKISYDYDFQSSIQMAQYEALYDRQCHSLIRQFEVGEANVLGLDLVQEALDKV